MNRPVSIDRTMDELRKCTNRDVVVHLACIGAATVSRCAVFLARHGDTLKGWDGVGAGITRDTIRNLWLPMSSPSIFRDVVIHAQGYNGLAGVSAVDILFQTVIGSLSHEITVRPIALHKRVIALLYAEEVKYGDVGHKRISEIEENVVRTFENIVASKARSSERQD